MRELSNYLINLEETLSWRQYKEIGKGSPAHSDNTSTYKGVQIQQDKRLDVPDE